jgi:hypothetical protein
MKKRGRHGRLSSMVRVDDGDHAKGEANLRELREGARNTARERDT